MRYESNDRLGVWFWIVYISTWIVLATAFVVVVYFAGNLLEDVGEALNQRIIEWRGLTK